MNCLLGYEGNVNELIKMLLGYRTDYYSNMKAEVTVST